MALESPARAGASTPLTRQLENDPVDDVRLAPTSPHQHAGLLDRPFLFVNGFEAGDATAWSSTVP
jgi:hypothetical protein